MTGSLTDRNILLRRLTKTAALPIFRTVMLSAGQTVARENSEIDLVYFPINSVISILVELEDGGKIEVASIGTDGAFGIGQALDHRLQVNEATVTIAGEAVVVRAADLDTASANDTDVRKAALAYEQFHVAQLQQNVACNAAHSVMQRFCRLLLRAEQLVGSSFEMTHDHVSGILATRRTSITQVATQLRDMGGVAYQRGKIQILDKNVVAQQACECHEKLLRHYNRLVIEKLAKGMR